MIATPRHHDLFAGLSAGQQKRDFKLNRTYHSYPLSLTRGSSMGFTLIELLIILVVLSLMVALAIPSFTTLIMNAKLSANTDNLVNALTYARNTALSQSLSVQVCPLGALNATTCGTSWSAGWVVITLPATGAPSLLKSQQLMTGTTLSSNVTGVLFDNHGIATTSSTFTMCDKRGGGYAGSIQVLPTGYVQSGSTPGIAVWNNGVLTCP